MFLGVSTLNLDAKGRIAIPAKHRETLAQTCASRVVVTINPNRDDRCLWLYPENEWREIARNLSRLPPMIRQNQLIQRLMLGHASEVELDGQGRVLLPNELREYAGLHKDCVILGIDSFLEIWDDSEYRAYWDRNEAEFQQAAEELGKIIAV